MGEARKVIPKRGDVFLINFDPTIGAEIQKTRPALILQNDIGNRYSPVTIVAAISSLDGAVVYPTEVPIEAGEGGVDRRSVVLLNQIRTIDKGRLIRKLGALDAASIERVDAALLISLGLTR
jgi:mRNA interferase MazF